MDDQLAELLKSLKAAQDILQADAREERTEPAKPPAEATATVGSHEPERKVSLGDVAKAHKDYEREPLDRK